MNAKELARLAQATDCREISGYRYQTYLTFRHLLGGVESNRAEWLGWSSYRNVESTFYTKPDIRKETTYEACTEWHLRFKDGEAPVLEILVRDGDTVHGWPKGDRCRWFYEISEDTPEKVLDVLTSNLLEFVKLRAETDQKDELQRQFDQAVARRYECYLDSIKDTPVGVTPVISDPSDPRILKVDVPVQFGNRSHTVAVYREDEGQYAITASGLTAHERVDAESVMRYLGHCLTITGQTVKSLLGEANELRSQIRRQGDDDTV